MIKTKFFISPELDQYQKRVVEIGPDDILVVDNFELRNASRIEIYEEQLEDGTNAAVVYDGEFEIGRFKSEEQLVVKYFSRLLAGENLEPKGKYIMMFGRDEI